MVRTLRGAGRRGVARSGRPRHRAVHWTVDILEPRTLLSNVSWTGQGDGTTWTDASNWSNDAVPGPSDNVAISKSGNPTIAISSGTQSVNSISSTDPISISGGSLSVAANSTLSGGLTMTGGSLTASGSGVSLTVTGTTTDSGGSLYAENGASLSLNQLASYTGNATTTTLEATGAGSTLNLTNLASVTQPGNTYAEQAQFEALAGGRVNLPALKTINTGTVILESDGTGSTLNVAALTGFTETGGWTYSTLQASTNGTVDDSSLTSLSNVNLNVDGAGQNLTLAGLTSYSSGNITVSGGATLSLPGITSYTGNATTTTLEATGAGSTLTLANLASVTQPGNTYAEQTQFEALAGGRVNLPALKTINTGTVILESDGTGSTLNVAALTGFTETGGWTYSTLQASTNGTVDDSSLTSLSNVNLNVDGAGQNLTLAGLTSYGSGNITVSGGATLSLPGITSYTGNATTTTLEATGAGSTLNLANLASVTQPGNTYAEQTQFEALAGGRVNLPALKTINTGTVILESDGTGSTLNVAALTGFTETGGWTYSTLQASTNGTVDDSSLTSLSNVNFNVDGAGQNLTLAGLTSYASGNITVSGGATLSLPGITSYTGNATTTTLEATGAGSTLTLANLASVTQPGNTYAEQTQFEALAGGRVNLPALKTINTGTVILESDGTGSTLNVPALTSLIETNGWTYSTLQASNGGTVADSSSLTGLSNVDLNVGGPINLSGVTDLSNVNLSVSGTGENLTFTGPTSYGSGTIMVSGGATLSLPTLTSVDGSTLEANGGTLTLPALTSAENAALEVSGGGTLIMPAATTFTAAGSTVTVTGTGSSVQIGSGVLEPFPTSGSNGTIDVPAFPQGLTVALNPGSGTFSGGTTLNVEAGATVSIESGTYTGGITFNVGQGAVIDLTGGETVTYGGTLTGSGSGTVQFSGGSIDPAAGSGDGPANAGLILNFSGSMFQWTGGGFFASKGNVTNLGTINLAGASDKGFYEDGTLYNEGTLIQTGTGNLDLHSDNVSPTTLVNEVGASYLIESDSGIDNGFGGETAVVNSGTIRKTAGTGTSALLINGALTNTGTIEADSGTLDLAASSVAQISERQPDRRHLERARRRDPPIPQRHDHHRQRRDDRPWRQRCDDRRALRAGLQQRQPEPHRRGRLDHRGRLQQQREPDRRRRQHAQGGRQLHAGRGRIARRAARRHARQRPVWARRGDRLGGAGRGSERQPGEWLQPHARPGLSSSVVRECDRRVRQDLGAPFRYDRDARRPRHSI